MLSLSPFLSHTHSPSHTHTHSHVLSLSRAHSPTTQIEELRAERTRAEEEAERIESNFAHVVRERDMEMEDLQCQLRLAISEIEELKESTEAPEAEKEEGPGRNSPRSLRSMERQSSDTSSRFLRRNTVGAVGTNWSRTVTL